MVWTIPVDFLPCVSKYGIAGAKGTHRLEAVAPAHPGGLLNGCTSLLSRQHGSGCVFEFIRGRVVGAEDLKRGCLSFPDPSLYTQLFSRQWVLSGGP